MAIVSIIGNIDLRLLAFPLMRALSIDGKTRVITSDTSFTRLYSNVGFSGKVDDIDIKILTADMDDSEADNMETDEKYKHTVYVSKNFVCRESTDVILCRGIDRSFLTTKVREIKIPEGVKLTEVKMDVSIEDSKDKGVLCINSYMMKYLFYSEQVKSLESYTDSSVIKVLSKVFNSMTGISEKNFAKLVARDFVESKK